jgi:hypothetical protein
MRLASSNTGGESQKIASEELVETKTKLLFARAALERYSGSNSLGKVLACLFDGNTYSDTVFCFADTVVLLWKHSDFATKTHHFPPLSIVSTTNAYTGLSRPY